jgi:hypothetical protein
MRTMYDEVMSCARAPQYKLFAIKKIICFYF